MALMGSAALAMWWDIAADVRLEFEDWHSHEHFRERLSIPGFQRATRWSSADGGEGVFQIYELSDYAVLGSSGYLDRLNAPTPWSTKMMPHHRNMIRSQCHVLESVGGAVARHALTARISPEAGKDADLRSALKQLIAGLPGRPGFVGGHLLRHETPQIAQTTEQKIRGGDQTADWVLICVAYDTAVLDQIALTELSPKVLQTMGAKPGIEIEKYILSYSETQAGLSAFSGQ